MSKILFKIGPLKIGYNNFFIRRLIKKLALGFLKSDADLEQIEKDLVKKLGLRIKISPSKAGGGKVVLAYASVAELDMILDLLEQNRKAETAPSAPVPSQPAAGEKFTIKMID